MKKFVDNLPDGGIPFFADDFMMLQQQTQSIASLFASIDSSLIVSGCNVQVITPGPGVRLFSISPGYVYLEGEVMYFAGTVSTAHLDNEEVWIVPGDTTTSSRSVANSSGNTNIEITVNRVATFVKRNRLAENDSQYNIPPAGYTSGIKFYPWPSRYLQDILSRKSKKIGEVFMYYNNSDFVKAANISLFSPTGLGRYEMEGFALCNGNVVNGTLDFQGKFPAGYNRIGSNSYNPEYSMGRNDKGMSSVPLTIPNLPSHSHGGKTGGPFYQNNAVDFNHEHNFSDTFQGDDHFANGNGEIGASASEYSVGDSTDGINNSSKITAYNSHYHTILPEGGGIAHENRPPYIALAFVQRIS